MFNSTKQQIKKVKYLMLINICKTYLGSIVRKSSIKTWSAADMLATFDKNRQFFKSELSFYHI